MCIALSLVPPATAQPRQRNPVSVLNPSSRLPAGMFVQRGFDPPAQRWLAGHRGVDLAAVLGEPVLAPAAGVVYFAGDIAGVGTVSILHVGGLRSTYQPVKPLVAIGEPVLAQMPIGVITIGSHCAPPPCLHWGARRGLEYVNPLLAFHIAPTLLPW